MLPAAKTPLGAWVREHLRKDPIAWLITVDARGTEQPNPIWFVWEADSVLVYNLATARHGQRSAILDEFVAATGYERKYAIRLLLGPIHPPEPIRRPRAAHYLSEVQQALTIARTAANGICGKRLVPFLPELVPTL